MALRDTIRKNAEKFLEPGEHIQAVIPAQTTNAYLALISYWIIVLTNAYRTIVVTDRRILVCHAGRFRLSPVKAVVRQVPRATVIGPAKGLWYRSDNLGERLYINKRFHKDVLAADTAGSSSPAN